MPEWCVPGARRGCDRLRRLDTRRWSVPEVVVGRGSIGKTHMASALCALACERRLEARIFTASSLVMRLRRARDDGRLDRGGAHRQGPPARHRRARVSPARRGRGEAALPGLRRRIREAVGGNHHELGIQQVGVGVRGRPDGRRRDRPHRPPREARPVPRRVLPRPPCPHAGGLAAQKACALPMLRLLNFR